LASKDVPRYVTADARVSWAFAPALTLAVVGQNLLQPQHVEFFRSGFASAGIRRSVYASLTWRR
jgi:iron complex outermembrane receptor protein